MCGIAGFIDKSMPHPEQGLRGMAASLGHRGPDDEGYWYDLETGMALAHRRLSILDLSPAGHQPMHSASGRYVLVYNGEIYNYRAIRGELEKISPRQWRGHSDTEVMLEAFEEWGVCSAVNRLVGMFAIALWDKKERILHLIRDRIGEKPLYYGCVGKAFLFASELKALKQFPKWDQAINRDALALFIRHNYIPAPHTIYEGVFKLPPGTLLSLPWNFDEAFRTNDIKPVAYWSAKSAAQFGLLHPFEGTEEEAVYQLDTLLRDAIRQQMEADVPLGAFLSGGVDSSAIVALMQAQSTRPVRSFTIGFHEKGYDEARHAKVVARHLGTEHTELYVNSSDALSVIPKLPVLYDEPFSDSSQIPTFVIAELTRRHVTVSLSGDAGDELFGGYNRYFWADGIWRKIGWLPRQTRAMFSRLLQSVPPRAWDSFFNRFMSVIPQRFRERRPGDQLHKLGEIITVQHPFEMYHGLVSHWKKPADIVLNAVEPPTALTDSSRHLDTNNHILQMMYMDLITYLPDDILVKIDRAAMGVSLETRVPFLDHRVVEFAWKLPLSLKIRNGQGKWILRQVLYKYVPREIIERPKTGFGVPIGTWLRTELRDWAESLMDESRLRAEGFFNPHPIRQKWGEHLSGICNWQYYLWDILMFQAWLERNK
jgi:asparagine synthase (glutamine-hydrolysing)